MKYCSNCVMPDTKPGVYLDENGDCNACRSSFAKKAIDWDERFDQLRKITDEIKEEGHPYYDCIVPVSGGKDSWIQALILSEELGLKVLCVTLANHLPTTEGIKNLNNMIKDLNVDHMKINLKPSVYRKIRHKCTVRRMEPNWAEHCAVFASVVNVAVFYDVPLIVWGEDIAFEFGGGQREKSEASAIEIDKSDLNKDKLTVYDWLDDDLSERDTLFYQYPDYKILEDANIRSIYLGHYINWYGRRNFEVVHARGFTRRKKGCLSGNYLDYDNIDEKLCEVNIWFKYIKYGFWRATDQCCYDIWAGTMSRNEAIDVVNRLSTDFPHEYFSDFLKYHMLSEEEFWDIVERFRNKDIWDNKDGEWKLKYNLVKST